MKKWICLFLAAILCLSLAAPAFAAENEFVPSITYKPQPQIVPYDGERIGTIRNSKGEILDFVQEDGIRFTPVADVYDSEGAVPPEIRNLLQSVYEALSDGSMKLPYEKFGAGLNPANMVIRDLFDASLTEEAQKKLLQEEGVTLELTFDLGVAPEDKVFVMFYDEETQEWIPVNAVSNGDGTVTCTFEKICPIAVSVQTGEATEEPEPEPVNPVLQWIASLLKPVVRFLANLWDAIRNWF